MVTLNNGLSIVVGENALTLTRMGIELARTSGPTAPSSMSRIVRAKLGWGR